MAAWSPDASEIQTKLKVRNDSNQRESLLSSEEWTAMTVGDIMRGNIASNDVGWWYWCVSVQFLVLANACKMKCLRDFGRVWGKWHRHMNRMCVCEQKTFAKSLIRTLGVKVVFQILAVCIFCPSCCSWVHDFPAAEYPAAGWTEFAPFAYQPRSNSHGESERRQSKAPQVKQLYTFLFVIPFGYPCDRDIPLFDFFPKYLELESPLARAEFHHQH